MTCSPGPELILIAETVVATKSEAKVFILSFCFSFDFDFKFAQKSSPFKCHNFMPVKIFGHFCLLFLFHIREETA